MQHMFLYASLLGALGLASPALAQSSSDHQIGTVSCHVKSSYGSYARAATCFYSGDNGAGYFEGRVSEVGFRAGYHRSSDIAWSVYAPNAKVGPSDLSGHYGVNATAASGATNALAGGWGNEIVLRPVGAQTANGLDLARDVAQLTLGRDRGAFSPA
ncbi:MAG TPA: DUF992 domain-containing protein [Caulobacteraceae bacterium]|nr:DUF992 domain-containing protein [Caulobacteraceae bacterium]